MLFRSVYVSEALILCRVPRSNDEGPSCEPAASHKSQTFAAHAHLLISASPFFLQGRNHSFNHASGTYETIPRVLAFLATILCGYLSERPKCFVGDIARERYRVRHERYFSAF